MTPEEKQKILDYIKELLDDDISAFDNPQFNFGYEEACKHIKQFIEKLK